MPPILIKNGCIATMDEAMTVHESGWLRVEGEIITHVEPAVRPIPAENARIIDASGMLVLPGLVNAHTHLGQTLMRGAAVGGPLEKWLNLVVRPLESVMTATDQSVAARLGLIENLRHGITAVIQHQKLVRHHDFLAASVSAAVDVGIRLRIARGWRDSGRSAESPDQILRSLRDLHREWHLTGGGLVTVAFGPMVPHHCSTGTMLRTVDLAQELEVPIHIHVSETADEVDLLQRSTGMRPVDWLASVGALNRDLQLVHGVWLDDREIDLLAEHRATVIHCPVSNLFLSSGMAPIGRLLERGVKIAFGTDGAASGGTQDILEAAKLALLLSGNANVSHRFEPGRLLKCVTSDAAGLVNPDLHGALTSGAKADLSVFDLQGARTTPSDLPSTILFSLPSREAHTVLVNGRIVLDAGQVTTVDEGALRRQGRRAATDLFTRAGRANNMSNSARSHSGVV